MNIQEKIRAQLDNPGFPDLKFFTETETLDASLDVFRALLDEEKKDFQALIKKQKEDVTFDDFEDDSLLDYFWSIINHLETVSSNEKTRKIIETFMPEMQDFGNEMAYNKEFFERLEYIYKNTELDTEQKRSLEISLRSFKERGIDLPADKQEKIKVLNKQLSKLSEKFTHNIVDEEKTFEYIVENKEDIAEVPEEILTKAEKDGKWIFDADPTTYTTLMKYAPSQKVRRDMEYGRMATCSQGKYDNRPIVLDILKYGREKAELLGYENTAYMNLQDKMADSPQQITDLILSINEKVKTRVAKEQSEIKEYFKLENLESYDIAYYKRKLETEKYALDEQELKKYFELETSLEYMLTFTEKFYDVELKKIDIESHNENIRAYEVYRNGEIISYYLMDLFYRAGKRAGAWADNLRARFTPSQ